MLTENAYRSSKEKASHHRAGLGPRSLGNQYTWELNI